MDWSVFLMPSPGLAKVCESFSYDELLYWKYEDGRYGSAILPVRATYLTQGDTRHILSLKSHQVCKNREAWITYKENLQEQYRDANKRLEVTRLDLTVGLSHLREATNSTLTPQHLESLLHLIQACGVHESAQAATVTLFSVILAGYFSRTLHDHVLKKKATSQTISRAPIVAVSDHDTFDVVKTMMESLALDVSSEATSEQVWLGNTLPCVLEAQGRRKTISQRAKTALIVDRQDDSADMEKERASAFREHPFPAQYQDTAVLIETKRFSSRAEIRKFQLQNRWVTTLLYAPTDSMCSEEPIYFNSKPLQLCAVGTWDQDEIQTLLRHILWKVSRFKKKDWKEIRKIVFDAEQALEKYNRRRGTRSILGHRKGWMLAQLLSVHLFWHGCSAVGLLKEEEVASYRDTWWSLLLPGYQGTTKPLKNIPLEDRPVLRPQQDSRELFQTAIVKILENGIHGQIPFCPPNSKEPEEDSWGCLREYHSRKDGTSFRAFLISSKQFKDLAAQYNPVFCNWTEVLMTLRKKAPAYFYSSTNCRIFGSSKSVNAIILNLEKASFLPKELKADIKKKFTGAEQ